MKKALSAIAAAAMLAGCGQSTAVKFTLTGTDPAFADGKYMYVITFAGSQETIIDSALIHNSSFTIKGTYSYPVSVYLYMGRGTDGEQIGDSYFILETGEIRVEKGGEEEFVFTGTPQNELNNELGQRTAELMESGPSPLLAAEACDNFLRTIVMENHNALGISLMEDLLHCRPGQEVLQLADGYPRSFRQHPALLELRATIAGLRADIGKAFIDIEGERPDGANASLADAVLRPGNRYVLLDFGALWCSPCRAEFPNLAALYEKYCDRGFDIFGVSYDVNRKRWVECIETFGMRWTQINPGFDIPPRQTKAWQDYSLDGIPASYLINCSTGIIIAKNLRGKALAEKIAQLLD